MEKISDEIKMESVKSMRSSIKKTEKALAQMTQKGANTTLIEKRLKAFQIGLALLENLWDQKPYHYTQDELVAARSVLKGLIPSINDIHDKPNMGSPQRTLAERRIKALELAIQAIDSLSGD